MQEKMVPDKSENKTTRQDKVISLFKFIEELNKRKQNTVLRVSDYQWWRAIDSFPDDPENIQVFFRDRVEEENSESLTDDILLAVHKPEFQRCPEPDELFRNWLEQGWNDYRCELKVKNELFRPLDQIQLPDDPSEDELQRIDEENQTYKEYFNDSVERAEAYTAWAETRAIWVSKQRQLEETRDFFSSLYKISIDLERESETLELVVADGFVRDRELPALDHPLLTRRVKLWHDAQKNTIYIKDTDVETELYTVMFQHMQDVNLSTINHLQDELRQNDYHPLDRNDLPNFLKVFIYQLSAESLYSENGVPDDWKNEDRLLLYRRPCYILRKRMDGALKAIEQIIEHVGESGEVPAPIGDIVDGGKIDIPEDSGETSVEEQLAAVGGESVDILLSKEANKEQLEIAKRIEHYNAVLVQGPPGTGKTHTIANLMGHFLAQGKSVLVTSHTKKALSVLKEKVAPSLQNLCVSMLDDSNIDMERSVDGITSYMSQYTPHELKKEMEALGQKRKHIISDLASVRKRLFAIIHQECNCIVYNGEDVSPSGAAAFVQENSETLSYIPGKVRLREPIPLSFAELSDLYRSNGVISSDDENEFEHDIPDPADIVLPNEFDHICQELEAAKQRLNTISGKNHWKIQNLENDCRILIQISSGQLILEYPTEDAVAQLKEYISAFPSVEPWMQYCAVDGKKGETYKNLWQRMIEQIQATCAHAEQLTAEKFGKDVQILCSDSGAFSAMQQLRDKFTQSGKISKLTLIINKNLEAALNGATINGQKPQNAEDCALILHVMEQKSMRDQCSSYWNDLMSKHGMPSFYDLDRDDPERVAANYIPLIERYLNWFQNEYETLVTRMDAAGLPSDTIFCYSPLDTEIVAAEKILSAMGCELPGICEIFETVNTITHAKNKLKETCNILQQGSRISSPVCSSIIGAVQEYDIHAYRAAYTILEEIHRKISLKQKRDEYLDRLAPVAPQWAEAIRLRDGIHGSSSVPDSIEDAWKWKQYCGIIEEITAEPFQELQEESLALSKEYRKTTAEYAEKSAWYHLLQRTANDISMKQALNGWKQTVKRIGKGTGKNAPKYRAEARKLMVQCQAAVPCWIMTVNKALESLNPCTNKFDVIIIDEASQSDISSLAILYMGRKLVIVGDDKQVSPMGIGDKIDEINSLKEMYIEGKIPNAHLYDAKTSIYDIAATTFQPLMLREHFRCVPEIIGFSNWLSYDFKIKPLRDCSNSVLLPAVVNYRVEDGERIGDTNPREAQTVVALMQACIDQPEYIGKTFGIISLQGDEQVKKIESEIYKSIDAKTVNERSILCGNASNFQGDERDVIFLSMVDCANGNGPVAKKGYGPDDAYRKRYNVAVSRARDQLWVVDSLDPANDLKAGDIRKMLIDYSLNPESVSITNAKIEEKADSPFESAVAKYLSTRGYHLVQQWKVGAYRLDMVAVCGIKKVAIECDGERWHSGEDKIREDMERQTILERLGWQFIRIRGSEYYRNPEKAMERVMSELSERGVEPEDTTSTPETSTRDTELLQRVKKRAYMLLHRNGAEEDPMTDLATVAVALDPKNDVMGAVSEEQKFSVVPVAAEDQDQQVEEKKKSASEPVPQVAQDEADKAFTPVDEVSGPIPTSKTASVVSPVRQQESEETADAQAARLPSVQKEKPKSSNVYEDKKLEQDSSQHNELKPSTPSHKKPSCSRQIHVPTGKKVDKASDDILTLLNSAGIQYVDKRANGGSLWIIGGKELSEFVKTAKTMGYVFNFKKDGGRATKGQPSWWSK